MSRSLPRRQEGKNIQGKGPVHAKHKGKKKEQDYVLVTSNCLNWQAQCW